jgi:transcriptional regulator with XRE-family HTH domain
MAKKIVVESMPSDLNIGSPKDLAAFVRARRTQSGLKQSDTASLCGVSLETLSRIETAKATVSLDKLFQVLNGLGIQIKVEPWDK